MFFMEKGGRLPTTGNSIDMPATNAMFAMGDPMPEPDEKSPAEAGLMVHGVTAKF